MNSVISRQSQLICLFINKIDNLKRLNEFIQQFLA